MSPMNRVSSGLSRFFPLVRDVGVGFFNERVKSGRPALHAEVTGVDGAQQKRPQFFGAAKAQEIARVRQFADRKLRAFVFRVKPFFELRHRHARRVAVVKLRERQGELRAKPFQRHLRLAHLREDKVGRLQHGGQIIHQRARPVENDVANHGEDFNRDTRETHEKFFPPRISLPLITIVILLLE
jgi:hypothetical protein